MARIDFIIPVYNEGDGLPRFHTSLAKMLAGSTHVFRFLYVNDGSSDDSSNILAGLALQDARICPIELSRNFGHQAALSAGLDAFDADAVVMMDGDGEHPVDLVPAMLQLYEAGYEVIQTQRLDKDREGFIFKRLTGAAFYRIINSLGKTQIVNGAADFRLLSCDAVQALRRLQEYHRFYRGMVQWIGFRSVIVPYTPAVRIAGRSKYSIRKMLRLASDGIFSFSLAPLRLALFVGLMFFVLVVVEVTYVFSFWTRGMEKELVPGWSSLMVMSTLSSGITMVLLGILGLYIGMIFEEVKRRPVYLVRPRVTADADGPQLQTSPGESILASRRAEASSANRATARSDV
jgi:glycosyltransferase involved in cell wall biosynthesis